MQDELFVGDRFAQMGIEDQACARPPIHVRGIETEHVSAVVLGAVHREVAVAQQLFDIGPVGRVDGDAHARV
jgi:hypothetical protein